MGAVAKERSTDEAAVTAIALDYFEGWFDGDVARMERALHPNLVKRRAADELGVTTKERTLELTWTRDGWRIANALWQPR